MPREFFEQAADALRGFLPRDFRDFGARAGGHNLKVWFGEDGHEHYEIQALSRAALRAGGVTSASSGLEIGFHAEHPSAASNDEALARLTGAEKAWRPALGRKPVAGRFAGRQAAWRRLSEIWEGSDFDDGAAIEAAERLAAYIKALEPIRRKVRGPA